MSNPLIEVTQKEFDEFIKNYPRPLDRNFFMSGWGFHDFTLPNEEDMVALHITEYDANIFKIRADIKSLNVNKTPEISYADFFDGVTKL